MENISLLYVASASNVSVDTKTLIYIYGAIATVLVGVVAAFVNLFLNWKNNKVSKENRFIDSISVERVNWINTLRDNFSEFLKLTHLQLNDFDRMVGRGMESIDEGELIKRSSEITYLHSRIFLFLNSTELTTQKLILIQNDIVSALCNGDTSKYNGENIVAWVEDLIYFQQVILKSEWRRVKEENKKGKEIDEKRMNSIYVETAKKIDIQRFNKFFVNQ
jgi:hypothetical protein